MNAAPSLTSVTFGVPAGAWRWAALVFAALALGSAGLAVLAPDAAGWTGYALLGGIAAVASLLLYAVWPRQGEAVADARRVAEAASAANVAWAITGSDGAVLDCNPVYRRMSGANEGEGAPPPELALAGEPSSAVLYRLSRDAAEGKAREETFVVMPGLEIVAAVRPLADKQTAWWFTPRLAASTSPQPAMARVAQAQAASEPAAPPAAPSAATDFAGLFRDAPMGVAFADKTGVLVEANAAFANFFSASVAGKNCADLVDAHDQPGVRALIARAVAGQAGKQAIELRAPSERTAELFASPQSGGAVLYLVDVSEQKALETKFAQSQKMQAVGQLAGGVAHDFNNLLTVIIGNCEFLLMRHPAGDPSFKEINEVHQNALRAAALVGQLLAFSRKQTMQPKTLALGDVIGELAQMLRRLLGEGINLAVEKDSDIWPVHADEAQLSNAIINLVVNARDAMPGGGTVTIRTSNQSIGAASALGTAIMPAGDYVMIEVADTRHRHVKGNPEQDFRSFLHHQAGGTGAPASASPPSYGIVKQSGGFITVDSDIGAGAAFKIYLPRQRVDASAPAEVVAPASPRDVTGQDNHPSGRRRGSGAQFRGAGTAHARLSCAGSQWRRGSP